VFNICPGFFRGIGNFAIVLANCFTYFKELKQCKNTCCHYTYVFTVYGEIIVNLFHKFKPMANIIYKNYYFPHIKVA